VQAEHGGSLAFDQKPAQHIINFAKSTYEKITPAFFTATGKHSELADILYMRLDIINTTSGPVLIECEGVEPELFFRAHLPSVTAFCDALLN
jgi:hypothetical protein